MTYERHIKEKQMELIWALSLQDYTNAQIARIFNINRSTVMRILKKKSKYWKPKWVKSKK